MSFKFNKMKKLLFALFFLVNVSCFSQTIYNVILEQIAVGDVNGPEAIAFDGNGLMYTANEDGRIIVLNRDGSNPQDYAQTGGRPLGLKFDLQGNLIVADAFQGLLSIDTTGQITVLSTSFAGVPFMLTDDLDIGSDGTIYFSDASSLNSLGNHTNDWGQPNGRLLSYNPNTDVTNLLLDNLYFANGVALSHDESYLLVNESAVNHIRRYWLTGPNSGQTDVFSNVNQFQGLPDNITYNDDSLFWVATFFGPVIALDNNGHQMVQILSYAVKYASNFYGPFRDAVGSNKFLKTDKKNYQMDFRNKDEALREVALDIKEGADMVMVKPGLPYLDVIKSVKDNFKIPVLAYQVSGEYSLLANGVMQGYIHKNAILESLISFKRAGASAIITYYADKISKIINDKSF